MDVASPSPSSARSLRIEIEHRFGDRALRLDDVDLETGVGETLSVTRLDYLLSGLRLQRKDGSWLETRNWFAYISPGEGRTGATLYATPGEEFQAIEFRVGVDPVTNASDPNRYPPGDPLHPQVNQLHWGWQGGYIFLALEGRYEAESGVLGGYSYHLATDAHLMTVRLPLALDARRHSTLSLGFDVARLFDGKHRIRIGDAGDSTHSRKGDPLAARLKANVEKAFDVVGVSTERFQELTESAVESRPGSSHRATPYHLRISERLPRARIPEDNALTVEGVALGRKLFFDGRLSRNNEQSCASCHHEERAFAEGRRFSTGVRGASGTRNAMPLFNLLWSDSFFWDGRASTLRQQVLMPIQDPLEMDETLDNVVKKLRADPSYPALFARAFGSSDISAARIGLSLEQFLFTKISQDSKFDLAVRGEESFSDEEKRGLYLFVTENDPARELRGADCFHCHGGNLFSDHRFANNGLDAVSGDPGRFLVTLDEADRGKFKVPSLRNVAVTAPYMHDGRFATLEEVVEHYNSGVKPSATLDPNLAKHLPEGLGLSDEDRKALVAFLKTLTDEAFLGRTLANKRDHQSPK